VAVEAFELREYAEDAAAAGAAALGVDAPITLLGPWLDRHARPVGTRTCSTLPALVQSLRVIPATGFLSVVWAIEAGTARVLTAGEHLQLGELTN
jgi:hypothetical protein